MTTLVDLGYIVQVSRIGETYWIQATRNGSVITHGSYSIDAALDGVLHKLLAREVA